MVSNLSFEFVNLTCDATSQVFSCKAGVRRAHLLDYTLSGALLLELYTFDGIGAMAGADVSNGHAATSHSRFKASTRPFCPFCPFYPLSLHHSPRCKKKKKKIKQRVFAFLCLKPRLKRRSVPDNL